MKTKFKKFVKKIKNWLSSLSKWAQKYKLKLFAMLSIAFLLICSMVTCSNNKKSASAYSINSDSSLIVLPNVMYNTEYSDGCLMPFYLGKYDNNLFLYYASSSDGLILSYNRILISTDKQLFSPIRILPNGGNYRFASLGIVNNNYAYVRLNTVRSNVPTNGTFIDYAITNAVRFSATIYNSSTDSWGSDDYGVVVYNFIGDNNELFAQIELTGLARPLNIPIGSSSVHTFGEIGYINANINMGDYSQSLIDQSYSNGYAKGYSLGYDIGFNDGIDYSVNEEHFRPISVFTRLIDDFLAIELWGDISLGSFLRIGFAVILLGFLIKIFFGG